LFQWPMYECMYVCEAKWSTTSYCNLLGYAM
jgi:hypothetical protein